MGLTTVGAVLTAIESAASAALGIRYSSLYNPSSKFANIDTNRKSFYFVDATRGEVNDFSITSLGGSNIGLSGIGLGIYGTASTPDSNGIRRIDGSPLHNDSLASRLYFGQHTYQPPSVQGNVSASAMTLTDRSSS